MVELSIVIPAYNEEQRLGDTLEDVADFVDRFAGSVEIIVVDDGSVDRTKEIATANTRLDVQVTGLIGNQGKGCAVRTGMLAASGRLRLFTDADASTAMDQFDVLATALSDMGGRGIAFASIAVPGAVVVEPQRGIRPTAGRMGNRIIRAFVLPGIKDSQRGFKLFSGDVADDIFARCVVDGWAFDVEVLAIARKLNIGVREVPVIWMHKDDSRVTAASYVSTLMDVLRIRWRISTGAYSASIPDVVDTSS